MKKLFILLFLISGTVFPHASPFSNNQFNFNFEVTNDFSFVRVKQNNSMFSVNVKKVNKDQLSLEKSKPVENELDMITLKSIPIGNLFLEFYDNSSKKIITVPAQELRSFSSHDSDVNELEVKGESRIYQIKIPNISSLSYANIILKESDEKFREIYSFEFESNSILMKSDFLKF
ncbi:MAG: hypothetical protein ISQ61_00625 [SAR86 cluster bacterium]|uniref:Uncharacterized protein n=1 Tax=SAR86 cluster bacterium TaxID=2030880 RepID=A0A937I814_9GAMM|nr:hypothetical protein [SAR86 cluster bacterium]